MIISSLRFECKYLTLPEILKENEEKHKNQVFYVTDEKEQSQYIEMFKKEGIMPFS